MRVVCEKFTYILQINVIAMHIKRQKMLTYVTTYASID